MFLEGKVALVTGSTSGIGLAIAEALAAKGAKLMINGFGDADAISQECVELGAIHDGADMSKPDEIERMMRRCADELGGPDILVNNAGIQHVSPVQDFPPEKWDAIIAINLSAAFHTMRRALPGNSMLSFGLDGDLVVAALGINAQRDIATVRRLIERRIPVSATELADPAKPLANLLKAKA